MSDSNDKGGKPDYTPPATQADLDKIIADRLSRQREKHDQEIAERFGDYDELKAKSSRLDEIEEANKTELQKAIDRAETAERTIQERDEADRTAREESDRKAELDRLIAEVATEAGVPADALRGTSREELTAHAESLKPLITTPLVIPGQGETPKNEPSEATAFVRGLFGNDQ